MLQSKLAVGATFVALLGGAITLGCGRDSKAGNGEGGSAGGGGAGNPGGASAATGGDDEGGSSNGGAAMGGRGTGGGAPWSMIGGCPSELCPNAGLPDGETCSVTVTCCEYQRLPEGLQGCTCTEGRWVCAPQRCACP